MTGDREPTFTLVRGGQVFAPAALGAPEILISGERILAVGENLESRATSLGRVDVLDASGMSVVPGGGS